MRFRSFLQLRAVDSTRRTNPSVASAPTRRSGRFGAFVAGGAIAIAATAVAGTSPGADATTSAGQRTVLTSGVPCRLADTRPDFQVGARGTPIGQGEAHTFAARGAVGQCTATQLPSNAVALALNVTTVAATADTFVTIWPTGTRPNSSSLNPAPGQPATPNAVTTRLSPGGSFKLFNNLGSVHVIVDVVGFYTDHDHDDRYDTSAEVDTKIATAINAEADRQFDGLFGPNGSIKVNNRDIEENKRSIEQERRIQINRFDFHPVGPGSRAIAESNGVFVGGAFVPSSATNEELIAAVTIPTGAIVTGVEARVLDRTQQANLEVRFYQVTPNGTPQQLATTMSTLGTNDSVRTLTGDALFTNSLMTDQFATYEVLVREVGGGGTWGAYDDDLQIIGFFVDYEFEVEQIP